MPASACGSRIVKPEKPKTFALAVISQSESGCLSTPTRPPGSNDTKKKSRQPQSMLRTAPE